MANALEGNSGAVAVVVVLVALVAGIVVTVVIVVVAVVVAVGEYVKVVTIDAVAPLPAQVAFTKNVPLVHAVFPPGIDV